MSTTGSRRRPARRALAVLAVVTASVVLAEVLVRLLLDPPGRWPASEESPVMAEHPTLGYALRPGASGRYTAGGYAAPIRINQEGWRDAPMADAVRAEVRLLAVGDSFTFGLGVDSTSPWPEVLERLLDSAAARPAAVLNAGVPGYSARQMRQVIEALLPALRPQAVLFGMNSETYWRVEAPYVFRAGQLVRSSALDDLTVGSRGLYYSPIVKWRWLNRLDVWLNQHFELGAHLLRLARRVVRAGRPARPPQGAAVVQAAVDTAELRQRLGPMLTEIGRAARVTRQAGARFVVVLINPQAEDGSFAPVQYAYNQVVAGFCRDDSVEVVDPLPALLTHGNGRPVFRSSDNYHWTREAHGVAAEAVYRYLRLGSPGRSGP
jgi:lysophospholipase L1-like esterase